MDILLTGASGFIGRNLLLRKEPEWRVYAMYRSAADFEEFVRAHGLRDVHPIRCDLTTADEVRDLHGRIPTGFDAILHLASNGDPAASATDPADDLRRGPLATVQLLSSFSCRRAVFFSSGAVYDGHRGLVGPETRLNPTLPYAISKLASEQYVKAFRKRGRSDGYVILRFFGAFGPFEPARKIYTRMVRWAATAAAGAAFEIRGNGRNLIDAMAVEDTIRAVKRILASDVADEVVDFATGGPLTINELVERAMRALDRPDARLAHVGEVPEYVEFYASPGRMKELFDFRPEISLEEGLRRLKAHLDGLAG